MCTKMLQRNALFGISCSGVCRWWGWGRGGGQVVLHQSYANLPPLPAVCSGPPADQLLSNEVDLPPAFPSSAN